MSVQTSRHVAHSGEKWSMMSDMPRMEPVSTFIIPADKKL